MKEFVRYWVAHLLAHPEDLEKMVFIAGPRQVGKTTLAEGLEKTLGFAEALMLNWDRGTDQRVIREPTYARFRALTLNAEQRPLVVLDELHKFRKWKQFLKGYYDTFRKTLATIVTGSARLNIYRRGGDSLLGRYWLYHLHPISVREGLQLPSGAPPARFVQRATPQAAKVYERLWRFGGFPEPYFAASTTHHRRWVRMRRELLVREDLRDLSRIHDLQHVETLMLLMQEAIGAPLSLNSLRESLDVSYNAVRTWMQWLEAIYYCFRVPPYATRIVRGLKKEVKWYCSDWSEVEAPAKRFENMVASHLLKAVDFWNDTGLGAFALHYVRDREKREVDFLVLREKKPWMLIEAKLSDPEPASALLRMAAQLRVPHVVLVTHAATAPQYVATAQQDVWISNAADFFAHFV